MEAHDKPHSPGRTVREITAERRLFTDEKMLSAREMAMLRVDVSEDPTNRRWVIDFEASVLRTLREERIQASWKYPLDWWEAFKDRWFPQWLRQWFPVKWVVEAIDEPRYNVCTHLISDPAKSHLQFLANGAVCREVRVPE